jgi:hypothetical protein
MNKIILGSTMLTLIVIGAVCGLMLMVNMNPVTTTVMPREEWKLLATGEGNPGAGAGGVLEILVYPTSLDPGNDYDTNLSNATAFCYGDNLNSALTGDCPYNTDFDLIVRCRANYTQAYNVTGSNWEISWLRANLTCADLSIGADTAMTIIEIANNTDYIWFNCYINNGGAGYQITHGQQVNVTSYKLQYWG